MNRVLVDLEGGVGIWGVHFFEFRGPILAFWVLPILGVFGPPGVLARFGGFSVFGGFGHFERFWCFWSLWVYVGVCWSLRE